MNRSGEMGYLSKRALNNAHWANEASQYGSSLSATASTAWTRSAVLRRLRKLIKPKSSVLEVGCGNASSLLGPLSYDCEAYGIDLTAEMLLLAKQYHKRVKALVRSDACYVPFRDASFDFVYTSRCLINVLDPKMQHLAMREVFRVAKPNGTVVFVENFEEPLTQLNLARERHGAGPQIIDQHNLALNLQETLAYSKKLGWNAIRIQGNTLASFVAHIILGRFFRGRARGRIAEWSSGRIRGAGRWRLIGWKCKQMVEWGLYPLYFVLTWLDDCFGARLPLLGKDVMITFRRA